MKVLCKECGGSGVVPFTPERGGPVCNTCVGYGHLSRRVFESIIATSIDYPSVYMGGPSERSKKLATKIANAIENEFDIFE